MDARAVLAVSALMSFVAFGLVTKLYIWPRLQIASQKDALVALIVPHTFRFVGLSFLVPGVVSSSLPSTFAAPAAYGDLVAAVLACVATLAVANDTAWALPLVWVFNVWGAVDLVNAFYQGQIGVGINPGALGAAFLIPTILVPPLLVIHGLIFWRLLRGKP